MSAASGAVGTVGAGGDLRDKPGPWIDLGLTLPIFLAYHAGVVFLRVQNATDPVTGPMLRVAEGNRAMYLLITAAVGVVFAGVFAALGRGQAFRPGKFVQIAIEGVVYAVLMRLGAAYVVGRLFATGTAPANAAGNLSRHFALDALHATPTIGAHAAHVVSHVPAAVAPLAPLAPAAANADAGPFVGLIMSLGAGFYEELAFRVILFGLGAKLLVWIFAHQRYGVVADQAPGNGRGLTWRSLLVMLLWSAAAAAIFSGIHYIGALGDSFQLTSFVFRMVLGLVLTAIFVFRGFAAAVWAHALYDVWVLVFPLF